MGKDQSLKLPYPLILASTSKYRKELLSQLGWPFEAFSPEVNEDELKTLNLSPEELASRLSKLKAEAVFQKRPDACVIGSDQVCSFESHIFSKPGKKEEAIRQLMLLQGRSHKLLTAVTVMTAKETKTFLNQTILHMRPLALDEAVRYVEADEPFDCAGSYKLESRGIKLFHQIEMSDHTSIIGLPLIELTNILVELGYPL